MMKEITFAELKDSIEPVMREMAEDGTRYTILFDDGPLAMLEPVETTTNHVTEAAEEYSRSDGTPLGRGTQISREVTLEELRDSVENLMDSVIREGNQLLVIRDGQPFCVVVPCQTQSSRNEAQKRLAHLMERVASQNADVPPEQIETVIELAIEESRRDRRARKAG